MNSPAIGILRDQRHRLVDRLTANIMEAVPRYALIGSVELRASIQTLMDEVIELLSTQKVGARIASESMSAVARRRVEQGVSASDFITAMTLAGPACREILRDAGLDRDPELQRGFEAIEGSLNLLTATAASVYVEAHRRQLEAKNQALNRVVQELRAHERVLSNETAERGRALDSANEFNRRVIESLSSGVLVLSASDAVVQLYSSRCEEILGIPSEQVLGQPVEACFADVKGLDLPGAVEMVRNMGHLPLTKVRLEVPGRRALFAYVRAQRMFGPDGEAEGTVVVIDDVSERELLIDSFSRYVSRDVVQQLLARARGPELEGERRTATLLFADIRGFTTLAERETPERLHALLNAYFRVMIAAITAHGGVIDKFVGDKVMALFCATGDPASTAENAVRAAQQVRQDVETLSASGTLPSIALGIGLNTGEVVIGNVGSEERMDFTAIGDAVNVADRLQSLALGAEILIGERTAALVRDRIALEDRGEVHLKGRTAPEHVYAVR